MPGSVLLSIQGAQGRRNKWLRCVTKLKLLAVTAETNTDTACDKFITGFVDG